MVAIPSCVLIDPTTAQVRAITVGADNHSLVLQAEAIQTTAPCPLCGHSARRIHSRSHRTLADVAWALVPVRTSLHVRRFFCDQPDCRRRIFTERVPSIAKPYARRTTRLARVQQQIAVLLGGAAGARLCATLGYPAGVDLLLARMRQRDLPATPTPRVRGLADWAMRKGQRSGTILVDHERGQVVDLLPDRTPAQVRQWLHEHPGVEIVTRDRAAAYAQGITDGAPDALQVADRWHLRVRRFTRCLISVQDGKGSKDCLWVNQRTLRRKPMGTRACW